MKPQHPVKGRCHSAQVIFHLEPESGHVGADPAWTGVTQQLPPADGSTGYASEHRVAGQ